MCLIADMKFTKADVLESDEIKTDVKGKDFEPLEQVLGEYVNSKLEPIAQQNNLKRMNVLKFNQFEDSW